MIITQHEAVYQPQHPSIRNYTNGAATVTRAALLAPPAAGRFTLVPLLPPRLLIRWDHVYSYT
jgi:hypothetical protein